MLSGKLSLPLVFASCHKQAIASSLQAQWQEVHGVPDGCSKLVCLRYYLPDYCMHACVLTVYMHLQAL